MTLRVALPFGAAPPIIARMGSARTWAVLLIGGASGVGKTSVSYRLARHYDTCLTEIDDFQAILQHMTTPEEQPIMHFWRTHPEAMEQMNDDQRLDYMLRFSAVMGKALEHVIANHLETRTPVVLEGDFILPALAKRTVYGEVAAAEGLVRALFLHETDEAHIAANFAAREGQEQPERARASWRHNEWLRAEAGRLALQLLQVRPWDSVLERAVELIDGRPQRARV